QLLDKRMERPSLWTLSIREGFEGNRPDRLLRIGVDISIWMRQLQQVFIKNHAQAGENPELKIFFYRLAMLAERPVHLIFVADGALRPPLKRQKQVKTTPHWLTEGMRRFVDAFGYAWLEAAGEAEAELAKMNQLGIIDAVLTDDSDALVFGACTVIRKYVSRTDSDIVAVYRATEIRDKAGFSQGDLVFLALVLGSDYDPQAGLPRCGPGIARGLVRYGLGRTLYAALQSMSEVQLATFIPQWRAQLAEKLRLDPYNFIGRRHPSIAVTIPVTFPNLDVAQMIMGPALLDVDCYANIREPQPMNLPQLGQLCEFHFTWGSRAEIAKTFRTAVWPGEVVRMLIN
ncbi:PIN domain-like protein, partial [Trametes elegans]